jgi:TolB-like protein
VQVGPRVLSLLHLLASNCDRLVSKEEIVARLWDGRAVSDTAISTVVKEARKAAGDDGSRQEVIRTVHGLGFRCVASVHMRAPASTGPCELHAEVVTAGSLRFSGKPSIVVLPFRDQRADAATSPLGEALPAELIAALSKLRWVSVTARGSAFRFRDADPDLRTIAQVLNTRYCLSGLVENDGTAVAVSVELARTCDGLVIWSERFRGPPAELHEMRSRIAGSVVAAMELRIPPCEAEAARHVAPEHLDAWAEFHLGLQHLYRFNPRDNAVAEFRFLRAVARDPGFARAFSGLSFCCFQTAFMGYCADPARERERATAYAERSLELDDLDPFGNYCMGRSKWVTGDLESARIWMGRSVEISPNFAQGHYAHALMGALMGESGDALDENEFAMALSPLDPLRYAMLGTQCHASINRGDYHRAAEWAGQAARYPGSHYLLGMLAAAASEIDGNHLDARRWVRTVRLRRPDASIDRFFGAFPYSDIPERRVIERALSAVGFV